MSQTLAQLVKGANFTSAPDGAITVDSSGRFLVGTSSSSGSFRAVFQSNPTDPTLGGAIALSYTSASPANGDWLSRIDCTDSSANVAARIVAARDGGTWTSGSSHPGRLVFSTTADGASSPTERMRIGQDGLVYIRATGYTADAPNNVGFVFNPVAGNCKIRCSGDGTAVMQFYSPSGGTGGPVGSIFANASSTAYSTSSDYRLKENIVPLTGAANRLNQLQVHRFNFITDPDKTVDGFIAHEAQTVVPECVTGTKDEVDADGNAIYQGIDQSKLVPLLTAALQEALAEIESLKARVTALEP